jgi:hypothetical protein
MQKVASVKEERKRSEIKKGKAETVFLFHFETLNDLSAVCSIYFAASVVKILQSLVRCFHVMLLDTRGRNKKG